MKNIFQTNLLFRCITVLLMMAAAVSAAAQRKVTGTVTDETGEPLIGATVMVVGDKTGVVTDINGQFTLPSVKSNRLKISYVGYRTTDVDIKGKSDIQVSLIPNENVLDEVVVVGYGTQKRSDLTGSIASVSAKDVEGYKSSTVVEALSGKVAGVQIAATDGTPGAGFDIKVRGIGSVNGDTSPLFIVDGFQVDNIDYLANSDIESIEVLKDASAAAIYGSRAANGVVLVTTKSGKVGRPIVSYNGSVSTRRLSKSLDLLSPYQFALLQVEAWPDRFSNTYWREGEDDNGSPYRIQSPEDLLNDPGVDWQAETFRPTWSTDHNLSISGGNDRTKYNFAVSDFIENGIFRNSAFNKITAKMRVNHKVTDRISLDATVNYAFTDKRGMGTSSDNGRFNMLAQILRARPTAGLRMTNEELLGAAIDPLELESSESLAQVNPIKEAESVTNTTKADLWNANMSLSFNLGKGFTLRIAGTYNNSNQRLYQFYHNGSKEAYRNGQKPYGSNRYTRNLRWSNSNTLTYKFKRRKGHAFDVMLGQETSAQSSEHVLAASSDFPFDNLGDNNLGIG
ncbi:MAG: SusC/RagA family TonB-linked outer membrane protein, partial [Muribaculaceae bacterium]|nr:SusC/RagA family TonB-linked outer membrane protein [Muribaculaceae bacterium]